MRRDRSYEANPFEDANAVDALTYGTVDVPASGRVVAKPIDIGLIRPDMKQPRRTIPAGLRAMWSGDAAELPDVLGAWQEAAELRLGKKLEVERMIRSLTEPVAAEDTLAAGFVELVGLAASIYQDGLINPIRVGRDGPGYVIESGERRWLAYNLLAIWEGDAYKRIPAIERERVDVWAQAAENGARQTLNAIGMARQLALLIMDLYEGHDPFGTFEEMTRGGRCDRRFYAQVANGNVYPIKRGMGQRISAATGLSMDMIRRHRALLSIPDDVWMKADEQNWTERAIRDYMDGVRSVTQVTLQSERGYDRGANDVDSVTQVTLQSERGYDRGANDVDSVTQVTLQSERDYDRGISLYASARDEMREFDEDEAYRESLAALERDAAALRAANAVEQGAALIEQYARVEPILKLLKTHARKTQQSVLAMRMQEMLTISRHDVRRLVMAGAWEDYLESTRKLIERGIETLAQDAQQYTSFLAHIAEEIRHDQKR